MKKIYGLVTVICLALLFTSCKKDKQNNDSTDYYISANFGGTVKTYKANAIALKLQIDTIYSIEFTAYAATNSQEKFFLDIGLVNRQITTGTYKDEGPLNESQIVVAGYDPLIDEDHIYAAGLQEDSNPRLTITITTLTDKIASGTFSGTFYDHGGDGPGTLAVTDGKFNLPLTQ